MSFRGSIQRKLAQKSAFVERSKFSLFWSHYLVLFSLLCFSLVSLITGFKYGAFLGVLFNDLEALSSFVFILSRFFLLWMLLG